MTPDMVAQLGRQALETTLMVSAPIKGSTYITSL